MFTKNTKWSIAFFMIFLIVMIPFCVSDVYAADAGDECEDSTEETEGQIVKTEGMMEEIINIVILLYNICTVASIIDTALSTLDTVIGIHKTEKSMNAMEAANGCCLLVNIPWLKAVMEPICNAVGFIYFWWTKIYSSTLEKLCCFITCSWCTGGDCGFKGMSEYLGGKGFNFGGNKDSSGSKNSNLNLKSVYQKFGQAGIDPFNNIYFAIACLCPVAIVYQLKILNTIYKAYNCCTEKACTGGGSKNSCDIMLDYQLCMYWEGGLYIALVSALISLVSSYITKFLTGMIEKYYVPKCLLLGLWEIYSVPETLNNLYAAWQKMMTTFDEPSCEEMLDS